jgi:hypothetical protein
MTYFKPNYNVYGSKSAASFRFGERNGKPIINVELTYLVGGKGDWSNKVSFMITEAETPFFVMALLGLHGRFEAKFHGHDRSKYLALEWQDRGIFLRAGSSLGHYQLPISPSDISYIAGLSSTHLMPLFGVVSLSDFSLLLSMTTGRFAATNKVGPQSGPG